MQEQRHSNQTPIRRPSTDDPHDWIAYWRRLNQPWRREPEIGEGRQIFLSRRLSMSSGTTKGAYPFKGITLHRGDVEWLLARTASSNSGLDLRDSDISSIDLSGLDLKRLLLTGANACGLATQAEPERKSHNMQISDNEVFVASTRPTAHSTMVEVVDEQNQAPASATAAALIAAYAVGERNFQGWNLEGANLRDVDLSDAMLNNAILKKADLRGANLSRAKLIDADLSGADLSGANLCWAILMRVAANEAKLISIDGTHADFRRANLSTANLHDAKLVGAKLRRSILKGASLQRAVLEGIDLEDAILQSADLLHANLTNANLARTDLSHARLIMAVLNKAKLMDADLTQADIRRADLSEADLSRAKLNRSKLYEATLTMANLTDANLTGVDNLEWVRSSKVIGISSAIVVSYIENRPSPAPNSYGSAVFNTTDNLNWWSRDPDA